MSVEIRIKCNKLVIDVYDHAGKDGANLMELIFIHFELLKLAEEYKERIKIAQKETQIQIDNFFKKKDSEKPI